MALPRKFAATNITLAAYNQYRTTYPDVEVIGGVLWDTIPFVSAATLRLTLFNAARATPDLSNMDTPGMLTNNKAFLVRAIRWRLLQEPRSVARAAAGAVQAGSFDNLAQLMNTGFFRLTVGAKPYAEFPLWVIPGGQGPWGGWAIDGDTPSPGDYVDFATNGVPSPDNVFSLSQPLFISPLINFFAELLWPVVITLEGGTTNVQVVLDGDLMRPVQ